MKTTSKCRFFGLISVTGLLSSVLGYAAIIIDYVPVGDVNNAADTTTGYGAVSYSYLISKYEVTNAQYRAFLSAVEGAIRA